MSHFEMAKTQGYVDVGVTMGEPDMELDLTQASSTPGQEAGTGLHSHCCRICSVFVSPSLGQPFQPSEAQKHQLHKRQ